MIANMPWIMEQIEKLINARFTGSFTVNFYCGGITSVNKNETIKPSI